MTNETYLLCSLSVNVDSLSASYQASYTVSENEKISSETETVSLPADIAYVNPKQYYRILKRRESRAKLEARWCIPKIRKKTLHESRSRHARSRPRDGKGKFLKQENSKKFQ